MWLPPFKIIKGLFATSGQFTNPDGTEYVGPIHKTSDGETFTGSEPNKDSVTLTPTLENRTETDPFIDVHGDLKEPGTQLVYPEPENYKKGFFIRYYVQDTRNEKITEVNRKDYLRYQQELYIKGVEIKWILEKPAKDVFMSGFLYKGAATRNRENILKASLEIPTIKEYITDYEQFVNIESDIEGYKFEDLSRNEKVRIIKNSRPSIQEAPLKRQVPRFKSQKQKPLKTRTNLYTPGGRFKIEGSNQEYKGFYHIHPSKGAMEGAEHSDEFHRRLIPISTGIDLVPADTPTISTTPNVGTAGGGSQPTAASSTGGSGGGGGYSGGGGGGGGY